MNNKSYLVLSINVNKHIAVLYPIQNLLKIY